MHSRSLQKNYLDRPYYSALLEHPFIQAHQDNDISAFVQRTLSAQD